MRTEDVIIEKKKACPISLYFLWDISWRLRRESITLERYERGFHPRSWEYIDKGIRNICIYKKKKEKNRGKTGLEKKKIIKNSKISERKKNCMTISFTKETFIYYIYHDVTVEGQFNEYYDSNYCVLHCNYKILQCDV